MAHFDLEDTYLSLDGQGGLAAHPVEGFWESVDLNLDILSTLVSATVSPEDWPHSSLRARAFTRPARAR